MRTSGAYRAADSDAITGQVVKVVGCARELGQAITLVDRVAERGIHAIILCLWDVMLRTARGV
jgi:hypothetical protein